ncbi:MAG: primosomal protein N' [Betaproteobacteria bacterium]
MTLPVPAWTTFDYWSPDGLAVQRGTIVRVPLGRRSLHGVVIEASESSDVSADKLQPVTEVIDSVPPLPEDVLAMADFVSRYYQQPLGLVVSQMLPPLGSNRPAQTAVAAWRATPRGREALEGRVARLQGDVRDALAPLLAGAAVHRAVPASIPPAALATLRRWMAQGLVEAWTPPAGDTRAVPDGPPLNDAQQVAAAAIGNAHGFAPLLLQGVTGSGKTEVYLAAAARVMAGGGQVLVLVPEINLTPQLEQRVKAALPGRRIVTLHSRLAAGERHRGFARAAAGEADLVVGTRLAVFTPLPRLRLIVVDEEHDASFKQQDNVRYHGRDVAVWRAKARGVPIVLGSATPSLETLLHARSGRYEWLRLPHRAIAPARMPVVALAPAATPDTPDGLGAALVAAVRVRLERREQSLLFINRRGFAPSLLCGNCSWRADCPACSARLVMHREAAALRCHHCGHLERLPRTCPRCGNVDLVPVGQGTQRLEDALRRLFPAARIARIDRDTTQRKGAFAAVREQINAGALDILVGTQMLAKGHDFARLTLVGVLGGDNALYSADFRATERFGALLFQVAGRAGRAELPGEVIVQTDFPQHALYQALVAHDYDRLADALLADRRAAGMPPYAHLTVLAAEASARETVDTFLERASALGRAHARATSVPVEVFAPVPAMLARRAGMERGQVVVQSAERAALQRFLPGWRVRIDELPAHRVRWSIDVDPLGLL